MTKIGRHKERSIMRYIIFILRSQNTPISTNGLADSLGRSWAYTLRLLNLMAKRKLIRKIKNGRNTYWTL